MKPRPPVTLITAAVLLSAMITIAPAAHAETPGRTFYVDAGGGSDDASGRNPRAAWATTERVNEATFRPGDRVLFRAGDTWSGNIVIDDSGRADAPIVVGAYGNGPRPRIDGSFAADAELAATVLIHNAEHVQVRDLELTNDADDQGLRNGLLVAVDEPAQPVYSGYLIDNLHIHDVAGLIVPDGNDGKRSGGIGFALDGRQHTDGSWRIGRFDKITITDNVIEHVDQTGLWLDSNLRNKELTPGTDDVYRGYTWEQVAWTGVEIGWNRILDTGKNGVIIRMADGGSFHHNEVGYTSDRVASGNSVFTVSVHRFVVEWNEVHHNLSHDAMDGAALDPDLDSPRTVWRYNYSHDNNYGLITLCTRPTDAGIEVTRNLEIGGKGRLLNINYGFTGVTFDRNALWARPVPDVEYPDTHPDYVNPDREIAGGYPQLIWETHERSGTNFEAEQTYQFTRNAFYNEAETATFYLNPNDETSRRTTNRTHRDNVFYGLWPGDGSGDPIAQGFDRRGATPPRHWIANTIGDQAYAFWRPSIEGRPNPRVGPRS
ncbi:hypothetical protein [Microlunatus parietis]|uniref:Right handed beta helix region n=1 Tax=Microlunatus parietis TaxID=682979 RepID=A0A7Y9IDY7_9ACTN|nr:hypothetical protein [Microlunatus parietis]NYE75054.1 hypothetical protein [Microlunatus parietis]